MDIETATKAFSALGQETRLRVLKLLIDSGEEGLPAGDISLALGVAQNTLSFHLSHLERSGLVLSRRAGRYIIYRPDRKFIDKLILYFGANYRAK